MNSLTELRQVFEKLGKEVIDFTGYSMTADGFSWGLLHDNPVRGGVEMSPKDWREYLKALKAGLPAPVIVPPKPLEMVVAPVKVLRNQVTCPHCGKSGGEQGMKIHHFDRCKKKIK